ncbi:hypothetical protein D3C71_2129190 [compost metagenome]
MLYFPSKSDEALVLVPLTIIFAPGIGIPVEASVIVPFTVVCASRLWNPKRHMTNSNFSTFLIILVVFLELITC